MNRVTRFSSAALGMLLLAGLAYYQGHEDPMSGEKGSLLGTAVSKPPAEQNTDCKKAGDSSKPGQKPCPEKDH